MSPSEAIEEALHAASRFVLDHFACPEGNWYDGEAQLLNKKLRDALAALNEVAEQTFTVKQFSTEGDWTLEIHADGKRIGGAYPGFSAEGNVHKVLELVALANEALAARAAPTPSLSGLTEEERAMASRLEGLHAQMFGIASLGDPHLALEAISDNGKLHEAVHDCLRALPPLDQLEEALRETDMCVCGDRRDQHEGGSGPCLLDDGHSHGPWGHFGAGPCKKFTPVPL